MAFKVLVAYRIPAYLEMLSAFDVEVNSEERFWSKQEVIEKIRDKDAIICLLNTPVDKEVMDNAPRLKIISNYAVGYDNIDVPEATKRGIMVTNTPEVLTDAVAEHTMALILAASRRLVEAHEFTVAGKFHGWKPTLFVGRELRDKTLGIAGLGRIGSRVAELAQAFGMKIIYDDPMRRDARFERKELLDLLRESDVITLHCPLSEKTRHLIGGKELALLKDGALIVNTARGPIVDESALIRELETKRIYAALDVFENEQNVNAELLKQPNLVVTPHIASATREAREEMALLAAGAVVDFAGGRIPENLVNKEVLQNLKR